MTFITTLLSNSYEKLFLKELVEMWIYVYMSLNLMHILGESCVSIKSVIYCLLGIYTLVYKI